ncbi:hypothetical protein ACTA71_000104 [Dictyostelium dimigraforme]
MVKNFKLKFNPKFLGGYQYLNLWKSNYLIFYFIENVDVNDPVFISTIDSNEKLKNIDYKILRFLYSKLKAANNVSFDYTLIENRIFNLGHIIKNGCNLLTIKTILEDFENCIDPIKKSKFILSIIPNNFTILEERISIYNKYKDFINDKIDREIIKIINPL